MESVQDLSMIGAGVLVKSACEHRPFPMERQSAATYQRMVGRLRIAPKKSFE